MPINKLICYICNCEIDADNVSYVGKDLNGKEKYRHRKCSSKLEHKPFDYRKVWKIKPVTKIKDSDKIYNRNKEKQKFKKEYESN